MNLKDFAMLTGLPMRTIFDCCDPKGTNMLVVIESFDGTTMKQSYYRGEMTRGKPNGYGVLLSDDSIFVGQFDHSIQQSGLLYKPHLELIAQINHHDKEKRLFYGKIFYPNSQRALIGQYNYDFIIIHNHARIQHMIDGWEYSGICTQLPQNAIMNGYGTFSFKDYSITGDFQQDQLVKITELYPQNLTVIQDENQIFPQIQLIIGFEQKFTFGFFLNPQEEIVIFTNKFLFSGKMNLNTQFIDELKYNISPAQVVSISQAKNFVVHKLEINKEVINIQLLSSSLVMNVNHSLISKKSSGFIYFQHQTISGYFKQFNSNGFEAEKSLLVSYGHDDVWEGDFVASKRCGSCVQYLKDYNQKTEVCGNTSVSFEVLQKSQSFKKAIGLKQVQIIDHSVLKSDPLVSQSQNIESNLIENAEKFPENLVAAYNQVHTQIPDEVTESNEAEQNDYTISYILEQNQQEKVTEVVPPEKILPNNPEQDAKQEFIEKSSHNSTNDSQKEPSNIQDDNLFSLECVQVRAKAQPNFQNVNQLVGTKARSVDVIRGLDSNE